MPSRLQKRIAESGLMSRRAAEEAIRAGRVLLNGHTAVLGESCTENDILLVDGRPIPEPEVRRCYMLNKPRGYVCTLHDEKGRKSVRELLPESAGRVYPVGRLDIMSEGLLLLTNDGDLTLRLTHPSGQVLKTYRTSVRGEKLEEGIRRLHCPFVLDGFTVCAKSVDLVSRSGSSAVLDITVGEGRNRQIRRMCEEAGLIVLRLIRTAEGPLKLGSLPSGSSRPLTDEEIASLMREMTE
ncbi:MAG: rRNA pseudouridine synthase [Oscillospiraceae bacterium]|nr:rRNA pseudouridine synthase [Oscillospiraceae bacterium]